MEALRIIKRIASYGVFIAAATLFLLNTVTVTLAPYIDEFYAYENSFLPFMYVVLSLGVMLLFQLLVIGKPKEVEENIYPWLLMVMFAVMFFVSGLVLGKAIAACVENKALNVWYAVAGTAPSLILAVSEMATGIVMFIKQRIAANKPEPIESNGVTLTKEE